MSGQSELRVLGLPLTPLLLLRMDPLTENTELQPLLSGVHSVMRVKFALAGEGGGCMPTPFYYIYHHQ
jgi:hypothetical protein